jgi:putative dimethyl sulfoxide reductase chaperone
MTKEDLLNRQSMYALTSRLLLLEVDDELMSTLLANEYYKSLFPNFLEWKKYKEMKLHDLVVAQINADFTDISVMHIIPYESFYLREDAMIESGGDNPVLAIYNSYDFRVDLGVARVMSPDHIGVELEFIFHLVTAQLRAFDEGDLESVKTIMAIQEEFMREHLLQFAPMYLMAVATEAKTPFYHDVAKFSLEFILSDYEYIAESLDAKN